MKMCIYDGCKLCSDTGRTGWMRINVNMQNIRNKQHLQTNPFSVSSSAKPDEPQKEMTTPPHYFSLLTLVRRPTGIKQNHYLFANGTYELRHSTQWARGGGRWAGEALTWQQLSDTSWRLWSMRWGFTSLMFVRESTGGSGWKFTLTCQRKKKLKQKL